MQKCKWCDTNQSDASMVFIGPYWTCWDIWLCWVRFRQEKAPWLVGTLTERQLGAL